jgi:hypothetical protein
MTTRVQLLLWQFASAIGLCFAPAQRAEAGDAAFYLLGNGRLSAAVTGADCSVTSPDGATTSVPCEASGWAPTLEPGSTASMTATISYSYADDGRPLGHPGYFQVGSAGSAMATFESAALYPYTSASDCWWVLGHCQTLYDEYFGDVAYPIFLSNNDHAENVSGEIAVTTGWRWYPPTQYYGQGYTLTPNLFVDVWGMTLTPAIPEPSTWALMLGPLLGLALFARRRRRRLG